MGDWGLGRVVYQNRELVARGVKFWALSDENPSARAHSLPRRYPWGSFYAVGPITAHTCAYTSLMLFAAFTLPTTPFLL